MYTLASKFGANVYFIFLYTLATTYILLCFLDPTQRFNITSLNETIKVLYDNQEITTEASQELVSDDKISNSSSLYLTQAGYYCHEKYEMYLPFLDQAQFWIEGICLTIIAIIGLLGKCVTLNAYIFRLLGHRTSEGKKLDIRGEGGSNMFKKIRHHFFQFFFNSISILFQWRRHGNTITMIDMFFF